MDTTEPDAIYPPTGEAWLHQPYDSGVIESDKMGNTFFNAADVVSSPENLRLEESRATGFLVARFSSQLCQLLGRTADNTLIDVGVIEPFTRSDRVPGDIDLLLFDKGDPTRTTACEVKVLQKNMGNSENTFVHGIDRLKKGLQQCDGLLRLGFGEVYLLVILLANVSWQSDSNLANRCVNLKNWQAIRNRFDHQVGERKIGLLNIEITQTSHRPLEETGNIGGYRYRLGKQQQSADISRLSAIHVGPVIS